ncbi:hypothetical protein VNO77_07923 [Canavalia gladiata]|uniref:Secreted protein n=1 Tax=Canavalia gladiata TaxID=3824 RepID=A0AAN9QTL3_CANGL
MNLIALHFGYLICMSYGWALPEYKYEFLLSDLIPMQPPCRFWLKSYPFTLVVPKIISDDEVLQACSFRARCCSILLLERLLLDLPNL